MKRLPLMILAAPLLLASCSGTEANDAAPEATTVTESATVTTTQLSDAERKDELHSQLNSLMPMNQVNDSNLEGHCIMAISYELPGAGEFDFPQPVDPQPLSEGSEVYFSTGDFRYEDAQDVWQDGFYHCQVISENGGITDSSATVF